jgi:ubiquinone/menaquinone biosynthesis C-methylase UbiE
MNYFQELAAKYDAWFRTEHGQYVLKYEHETIMQLANVTAGTRTLDVGCGTGIYTQELLKQGATVIGIDVSPEMLDIARYKTQDYGDRISFMQADAAALPFSDNTFDQVISITAMEFFEQPRSCLHEMYRVLKPGGRMVVATLNSLSLWAVQRRIKSRLRKTIFSNTWFYSIYNLQDMLHPYAIKEWRGAIFIPPFFPRYLINQPDGLERWCQKHIPAYGAFIVARVDKNPE